METKTPTYVKAYVRNKKEAVAKPSTIDRVPVYFTLAYGALLLLKAAATHPGTAMVVLFAIGAAYAIVQGFKRLLQERSLQATKHKVVVNRNGKQSAIYL